MKDDVLLERAIALGIEPDFIDIGGQYRQTDDEVLAVLIHQLSSAVKQEGSFDGAYVIVPERAQPLDLPARCFPPARAAVIGEDGLERRLDAADSEGHRVFLPALPAGYYTLEMQAPKRTYRYLLLAAPASVYEPPDLANGGRCSGVTLQLYSLKSAQNWGIGDFADLSAFMAYAGSRGLDFVGINPLHALFTAHPELASPYSPSSRVQLNPMYLAVPLVPGFDDAAVQAAFAESAVQKELVRLRAADTVDYPEVWALKSQFLRASFRAFSRGDAYADARQDFAAYCAAKGKPLYGFALFEAIDQVYALYPEDGSLAESGWLAWPEALQHPDSEAVAAFAQEHEEDIRYFMWLQWLCSVQLDAVQQAAASAGVKMGLYGDLAVGAARGGADTWFNREAYCMAVSIGAPPDPLGPAGQNWQLPPLHPVIMQYRGYRDFIQLLRENMALYGVLRIDHVMALARLWWIASGTTAEAGAYVKYPSAVLMAILAIESRRNACVIIGEDLGIVPDGMRRLLRRANVFSYSVLYFSRDAQAYLLPAAYPEQAIAVTSTHDLAPLAGYWQGKDLETMRRVGIFDAESYAAAAVQRRKDKAALFAALQEAGCLPLTAALPETVTPELRAAVHRFGALSRSRLYAVQLENLLNMTANFNIPGDVSGYPNWAVKLPVSLEMLPADAECSALLEMIMTMRKSNGSTAAVYPEPQSAEQFLIDTLFTAENSDPFAYLGPHQLPDGRTAVRVLMPDAKNVSIMADGREILPLARIDARGLFAAAADALPARYQLAVRWESGAAQLREDVYRFGSTLHELDSWLLGEGRHLRPFEALGAHLAEIDGVKGVNFAVWAPNARRVSAVGEFNGWDGRVNPMRRHAATGIWEIFIPGVERDQLYKFEILDAEGHVRLKSDPYAFGMELRPGTASVVRGLPEKVPEAEHRRNANDFQAPISIYEVHLGSWRRRKENNYWLTYRDLAKELVEYVQEMGFTHIELMPLSEFPFDGSWGYQTAGLYAPTSRFGSPEELRELVHAAHEAGISVILDWVVGHFPTDEHGLRHFDGTALYEHADPREGYHQDWNTLIYNFGRFEVENYLRGNALYWIERFGFDGLRVDAVASMIYRDYSRKEGEWIPNEFGGRENIEAIEFLRRTNLMLQDEAPQAAEFAEESTSFPGVTKNEGLAFRYKWNMGWMNDTLRYMREDPINRKYHHHLMTFGMVYQYSENFVLPLSHDEVVHGKGSLLAKMPGDCWQQFANLRTYYGYMWGYPGKKLLFMGNEFAQGREWNYQEALDWYLLEEEGGWHRGVQHFVRDLNRVYRENTALYELDQYPEGFEWLVVDDADSSVFVFERRSRDGGSIIVISNFTPVVREHYRFGINQPGRYAEVLNSDDSRYNGSGVHIGTVESCEEGSHGKAHSLTVTVPPLATVFLRRE